MNDRRLYLSRDKVIAGVAGGVAEYFRIDPTIVRLLWAFAAFTGAGIVVYIVAMFIVPERPRNETMVGTPDDGPELQDPEVKDEAIEDLKRAARDLAESSGEVAQDVAERVRRSVEKLKASEGSSVSPRPSSQVHPSEPAEGSESKRNLGIILLLVGLFFLFRSVVPWFPAAIVWPLILVFLGVVFLIKGAGGR